MVKGIEPLSVLVSAGVLARVSELRNAYDVLVAASQALIPKAPGSASPTPTSPGGRSPRVRTTAALAGAGGHSAHSLTALTTPTHPRRSTDRIAEITDLTTRLAQLDRSAHVRNEAGVPLRLSVASHSVDVLQSLADVEGLQDDALVVEDGRDVAVDEVVSRSTGVRDHVSHLDVALAIKLGGYKAVSNLSLAELGVLQFSLVPEDTGAPKVEGTRVGAFEACS